LLFSFGELTSCNSFIPIHNSDVLWSQRRKFHIVCSQHDDEISVIGVVAPLTYSGPYACLGLTFPQLNKDRKQQCDNQNELSMNFVLDTGANVNTVCKDVAEELNLPIIIRKDELSTLGSAGAGGSFETGELLCWEIAD